MASPAAFILSAMCFVICVLSDSSACQPPDVEITPQKAIQAVVQGTMEDGVAFLQRGEFLSEIMELQEFLTKRWDEVFNAGSLNEATAIRLEVITGLRLVVAARQKLPAPVPPDNDLQIARCWLAEGTNLLKMQRIEESRSTFLKSLKLLESCGDAAAIDRGSVQLQYAATFDGDTSARLQEVRKATMILGNVQKAPYLPMSAVVYAEALKREAHCHQELGELPIARRKAEQALSILKTNAPDLQLQAATVEDLLARILIRIGEPEKARHFLVHAQKVAVEMNEHRGYAECRMLLADIEERIGNWEAAEQARREAVERYRQCISPRDVVRCSDAQVDHARALVALGRKEEARLLLDEAIVQFQREGRTGFAALLEAQLAKSCLDFNRADRNTIDGIRTVLQTCEHSFEARHPTVAAARRAYLDALLICGDTAAARQLSLEELNAALSVAQPDSWAFTDAELVYFGSTTELFRSRLLKTVSNSEDAASVYDSVWNSEAIGTEILRYRGRLRRTLPAETFESYRRLLSSRADLLTSMNLTDSDGDALKKIDREISDSERLTSPNADLLARLTPGKPEQLLNLLPPESAIVHIIRVSFTPSILLGTDKKDTSDRYVAFVLRQADQRCDVRYVDLGDARQIDQAIDRCRTQAFAFLQQSRGVQVSASAVKQPANPIVALTNLIWKPLSAEVDVCPLIYVMSGSGMAMVPWQGLYLVEDGKPEWIIRKHLICVNQSPGLLVDTLKIPVASGSKMLAVGGLRYKPNGPWASLPGTRAEIESAARKFEAPAGPRVVEILSGGEARKEGLLDRMESSSVIHLSTHFYNSTDGIESNAAANMAALIGRNCFVSPQAVLSDDVTLSAAEVLGRDLSNIELVVLSGCESSVGAAASGEGVMGMQRVFRIAGARRVVGSLWKVADNETAALMAAFYERLSSGNQSAAEALRAAQLSFYQQSRDAEIASILYGAWTIDGDYR